MDQRLRNPNLVLLGALTLGICADTFFYGRWLGISAPIFVSLCLVVLGGLSLFEGRRPTRANLWLAVVALFFAVCLAFRDAPLLAALDLIVVLGTLLLMVAHYQGIPVVRLPPARVLQDTFRALGAIAIYPPGLAAGGIRSIPIKSAQLRRLAPIGRGLLFAFPVLICFGALLMAADYVFASYIFDMLRLRFPFEPSTAITHFVMIGIVAYISAGGLQTALLDDVREAALPEARSAVPAEGVTQRLELPQGSLQRLGFTEALTVLLAVDGLFGGFMLVQAAYFFGGLDTLDRTGMTYAAYARRGFFELLMVTGLSLGLLWVLALMTRRRQGWQRRTFNGASVALILLMLGLLASAFQRMWLYEQAYGYTRLRLYTHSFMIWLAVVLFIFLVALLRNRLRIFTVGCIATGLIYLAVLNVVNPDALIVRENVDRYQVSGKLDTDYLVRLSADAIPALVASRGKLDGQTRAWLDQELIGELDVLQQAATEQGWPSWQVARTQALQQLRQAYGGGADGK